jgi:hypothetical protein
MKETEPLNFLTEFIENQGWTQFKNDFIPAINDPYYDYYDSEKEAIITYGQTEDGFGEEITYFKDSLRTYFVNEMRKVRLHINDYIMSAGNHSEKQNRTQHIFERLNIFKQRIIENSALDKYVFMSETMDIFIKKIKEHHNFAHWPFTSENQVISILENFANSVRKITQGRRKDKSLFVIEDEYDAQDLLYVILKSTFPKLIVEDPISKKGSQSSRIDFSLQEEGILIEVKMLRKDYNEDRCIGDLKKDIESYHAWKELKTLFCFVYDPERQSKDKHNFKQLEGKRTKNGHTFEVKVIVS